MPVTVIALERGHDTKEELYRNFGSAHPEGYRKALRQMKLAEKFTARRARFVDTAGAFCGLQRKSVAREGEAIAENLSEMMTLKTPIILVFIGEGGSGGAIGLAVADEVWMPKTPFIRSFCRRMREYPPEGQLKVKKLPAACV